MKTKVLPGGFIRGKVNYIFNNVLKSELQRKLTKGLFWTFIGTMIYRACNFLVNVVIARILDKEGYGQYGIIRSTTDMFAALAIFGLTITATKFIAEHKGKDNIKLSRVITLVQAVTLVTGSIIATILYFLSGYLAANELHAPQLADELKIGGVVILFIAQAAVLNGVLVGFESFKSTAMVNWKSGLISIPVTILLSYLWGVKGAVTGMAVNGFLLSVFCMIEIRKILKQHNIEAWRSDFYKEMNILVGFSLPAALSGMILLPVNWICNTMLVKEPGGYSQLGIYNAGYNMFIFVSVIYSTIGQVLLPYSVKRMNKGQDDMFDFVNHYTPWAIGTFFTLPFIFFPELGMSIFGASYAGEQLKGALLLILLSTVIIAQRQGIARNIAAGNYMWWSLGSNFFWGVIAIAGMYFLKQYGAIGRSLSYTIAYILNVAVFIPFYLSKSLCPRTYIISTESTLIWLIIMISFAIGFLEVHPLVRLLSLVVALVLLGLLFFSAFRKFRKIKA